VFNSQAARQKMERLLDISHLPKLVSHNAIEDRCFSSAPSRVAARQKLGFFDERFIFMYAGSIGPGRGIEQMVHTAIAIEEAHPEKCEWVIIGGGGANHESLQRFIRATSCGSYVTAIASQPTEQLPTWYAAADCLLAPYSIHLPAADVMNPM
jgi:glycosyltransferase involved in cell wall biosynthesis